jgi:hypothetical protein
MGAIMLSRALEGWMICQTCEKFIAEDSRSCFSCGEKTPKGIEIDELQQFDRVLVGLRDLLDNGDFAVDFEYAGCRCNIGVQRLISLIDEIRCSTGVQRLELEIG